MAALEILFGGFFLAGDGFIFPFALVGVVVAAAVARVERVLLATALPFAHRKSLRSSFRE
jgi:hypothetical protein